MLAMLVSSVLAFAILVACHTSESLTNTATQNASGCQSNYGEHLDGTVEPSGSNSKLTFEGVQDQIRSIKDDPALSIEERIAKINAYYSSLAGARIEDWCGYVGAATPNQGEYRALSNPIQPYPFSVWIQMRSSIYEGEAPFTDLILDDVPLEQVDQLQVWHDPSRNTDKTLQRIRFDGSLNYVSASGVILISNAQFRLAP